MILCTEIPLLDYIMITTLYLGWSAVFRTVAESAGIFFEVSTTSSFKRSVMNTECYIRMKGRFQWKNTEAYLSFMCFAAQDFEAFLRRFQFELPMIHVLS